MSNAPRDLETLSLREARWLTAPEALDALAQVGELLSNGAVPDDPWAWQRLWRKRFNLDQARLLSMQTALRRRARRKFASADTMLFTAVGLEQATDDAIGAHKATRFSSRANVADLCAGIGGDLVALARRSQTIGIERAPASAIFAKHNAKVCGAETDVVCGDAGDCEFALYDAWHVDPDRRAHGRTTRSAWAEPSAETLSSWLRANANGAVKLAPGGDWPAPWEADAELEWISARGECRQLVAWFGGLAQRAGWRRATAIFPDKPPAVFEGHPQPARSGELGAWLAEPDPAVIAARLVDALAETRGLRRVAPSIAYLSGDASPVADGLLAWFSIEAVLPLERRRIKAELRARRQSVAEIKCRGVDLPIEVWRRDLKNTGDDPRTLIAWRGAGSATAIIAKRWTGA